jgi:hypothetical protein
VLVDVVPDVLTEDPLLPGLVGTPDVWPVDTATNPLAPPAIRFGFATVAIGVQIISPLIWSVQQKRRCSSVIGTHAATIAKPDTAQSSPFGSLKSCFIFCLIDWAIIFWPRYEVK